MIDGQGDLFDSMIPPVREPKAPKETATLTENNMLATSYILSNVILSILTKNGITTEAEIEELMAEATAEYKNARKEL